MMNREETRAIRENLIAISLIVAAYDIDSNKIKYKINNNGLLMYATLLKLLGRNSVLNGTIMDSETIKTNYRHTMKSMIIEQGFIDFTPLDEKAYTITKRGMEHIKVMFNLHQKRNLKGTLNRLFSFGLKG